MNVKILLFPDGEDPDSFAKSNSAIDLKNFIKDNQEDFIKFKIRLLKDEAKSDPIKKSQMIREIIKSISVIPDKIKRAVFIKESSTSLDIEEEIIYSEVSKILRKVGEKRNQRDYTVSRDVALQEKKKANLKPKETKSKIIENELIRILVKYGNSSFIDEELSEEINIASFFVNEITENKNEFVFEDPINEEIFKLIESKIKKESKFESSQLLNHPNPEVGSKLADILSSDYILSDIWKRKDNFVESEEMKLNELVPEIIYAFKNYRVEKLLSEYEEKLKGDIEGEDMIQILKVIKNLKNIHTMLNQKLGNRSIL